MNQWDLRIMNPSRPCLKSQDAGWQQGQVGHSSPQCLCCFARLLELRLTPWCVIPQKLLYHFITLSRKFETRFRILVSHISWTSPYHMAFFKGTTGPVAKPLSHGGAGTWIIRSSSVIGVIGMLQQRKILRARGCWWQAGWSEMLGKRDIWWSMEVSWNGGTPKSSIWFSDFPF